MDSMTLVLIRKMAQEKYDTYDMNKIYRASQLGNAAMHRENLFTPDMVQNISLMPDIGMSKLSNLDRGHDMLAISEDMDVVWRIPTIQ